jgi:hypothetical protein
MTGIDRTKTGLLLITIGFLLGWIPFVGSVAGLLQLVGALLVILGRNAFGPEHVRNVVWSVILFVIGLVVTLGTFFAVVFSALADYRYGSTISVSPGFIPSFTGTFLVAMLVGVGVYGLAEVLFTYALQERNGRIILWCGYASAIGATGVQYLLLNGMQYLSSIPQVVPGIVFGYAYYLARDRTIRGETPPSPFGQ